MYCEVKIFILRVTVYIAIGRYRGDAIKRMANLIGRCTGHLLVAITTIWRATASASEIMSLRLLRKAAAAI